MSVHSLKDRNENAHDVIKTIRDCQSWTLDKKDTLPQERVKLVKAIVVGLNTVGQQELLDLWIQ